MSTVTASDRESGNVPGGTPLLSLRGVTKTYAAIVAVRNVDMDVYPGEVVGLLGDNGAGKSALVAMMSGVTRPTEGQIKGPPGVWAG
jgi:ABC-type sugar transport system ATPase subunit